MSSSYIIIITIINKFIISNFKFNKYYYKNFKNYI